MRTITEAVLAQIGKLSKDYPKEAVDAFLVSGTIHHDRDDQYGRSVWFGVRSLSSIAGVHLQDLNFALNNTRPGDQEHCWEVRPFSRAKHWDWQSHDEYMYEYTFKR